MNTDYINKVLHGDCLEWLPKIEDKSIDMILCDLPYGTTQNKWDAIIPFEQIWEQYERIIKDNGAIVLFGSQPFTSKLILSNLKLFKYELVWDKVRPSGHLNAKIMPMKRHENICVFGKGKIVYNPQMTEREKPLKRQKGNITYGEGEGSQSFGKYEHFGGVYTQRYPVSILTFNTERQQNKVHPTQKPVSLFEYLVQTYTNEGDVVLDNCMGSGTTAIACINTNRNFIGCEVESEYVDVAESRIVEALNKGDVI